MILPKEYAGGNNQIIHRRTKIAHSVRIGVEDDKGDQSAPPDMIKCRFCKQFFNKHGITRHKTACIRTVGYPSYPRYTLVMVISCRQSPQNSPKRKRKAKAVKAARVTGAVADKKRKRITANIIAATAKAAVAATNTSMKLNVDNVMKKFGRVYNDYKYTQCNNGCLIIIIYKVKLCDLC